MSLTAALGAGFSKFWIADLACDSTAGTTQVALPCLHNSSYLVCEDRFLLLVLLNADY